MKKLVLLSALVFGMVFYSCSSDDDNNMVEEAITLKGDWQLTNVDFTVMATGGFPTTDACIVELVVGYEFRTDNSFYFILTDAGASFPTQGDYWTWQGNISDFKIVQTNGAMPPYNFSLTPTELEVKKVDGKTIMTFQSEMSNGSAAKFTLVKGAIDRTKPAVLTQPDGSDYYCGFFD